MNGDSNSTAPQPLDRGDTTEIGRRSFLLAGAAVIGTSALSYGRIIGANDRISLGLLGAGRRGRELASVVADVKRQL